MFGHDVEFPDVGGWNKEIGPMKGYAPIARLTSQTNVIGLLVATELCKGAWYLRGQHRRRIAHGFDDRSRHLAAARYYSLSEM